MKGEIVFEGLFLPLEWWQDPFIPIATKEAIINDFATWARAYCGRLAGLEND